MTLLRDIQDAAINQESQVATLLRKCKVLAKRLRSDEFGRWVDNELNGYTDLSELPPYRILSVRSYGHFVGYFGKQVENAPIPPGVLPEEIREYTQQSKINMSISALAELAAADDDCREAWPADVVRIIGTNIYQDMNCISAWKSIPRASLVSILDTVRTRVLNFALEIEGDDPGAGDGPVNSSSVPEERVSQVFNTYITGTVQNLATGSRNVRQKATIKNGPSTEVFEKLLDAVSKAQGDPRAVTKMRGVVEDMRASYGTNRFGQHYQSFMSILADHFQVFGPLVAPYLPVLAQLAS